jgi:hypothetical protein
VTSIDFTSFNPHLLLVWLHRNIQYCAEHRYQSKVFGVLAALSLLCKSGLPYAKIHVLAVIASNTRQPLCPLFHKSNKKKSMTFYVQSQIHAAGRLY